MELYDDSIDYKALHLEWLKVHRSFRPKTNVVPISFIGSYYDWMREMYYNGGISQNRSAYLWFRDDYRWNKKSKTIDQEAAAIFGDVVESDLNAWFVTLSFDPKRFESPLVLKSLHKFLEKSYVEECYAIFEYHTENGGHPHLHMKLKMDKYKQKSKVIEKVFQSPLGKFLENKNFVDVKNFMPCHKDYLDYDKRPEKQEYLNQDVMWRKEQNLPEYVKK